MRFIFFTICLLSFILIGCQPKHNCAYNVTVIQQNDHLIDSIGPVFDRFWPTIQEPLLKELPYESYRLTKLHGFGNSKSVFRIFHQDQNYTFIYKRFDDSNNSSLPDSLVLQHKRQLTKEEWTSFTELTKQLNFWVMPVKGIDKFGVKDGHVSIMEGNLPDQNNCSKRQYHFAYRIIPEDTTDFKRLCDQLQGFYKDI